MTHDDRLALLNEMADRVKASGKTKKAGKSTTTTTTTVVETVVEQRSTLVAEEEHTHCTATGDEAIGCNCWHCAMFGDSLPPQGGHDDRQCNTLRSGRLLLS